MEFLYELKYLDQEQSGLLELSYSYDSAKTKPCRIPKSRSLPKRNAAQHLTFTHAYWKPRVMICDEVNPAQIDMQSHAHESFKPIRSFYQSQPITEIQHSHQMPSAHMPTPAPNQDILVEGCDSVFDVPFGIDGVYTVFCESPSTHAQTACMAPWLGKLHEDEYTTSASLNYNDNSEEFSDSASSYSTHRSVLSSCDLESTTTCTSYSTIRTMTPDTQSYNVPLNLDSDATHNSGYEVSDWEDKNTSIYGQAYSCATYSAVSPMTPDVHRKLTQSITRYLDNVRGD